MKRKNPSARSKNPNAPPPRIGGGVRKIPKAPPPSTGLGRVQGNAGGSGWLGLMGLTVTPSSKSATKPKTNSDLNLPTPGVSYLIDDISLLVLLQIKPRIPDAILNSGNFLTWNVEPTEEDFVRIQTYFNNSKDVKLHRNVGIKNILRITRVGDLEPNGLEHAPRKMLWHGTNHRNIGSILDTGFLPTMSHYRSGSLFFADRVAKSLIYCREEDIYSRPRSGWLFLCEVFLGKSIEKNDWSTVLPTGYDSIIRPGTSIPDGREDVTVEDCVWPVGKSRKGAFLGFGLNIFSFPHNEYLVFRPEQARPRYLIEWENPA